MASTLEKTFEITASRVDASDTLSPKSLLEILQDIAYVHADILGFGWDTMHQDGKVWVLSKMAADVLRPIRHKETLTVTTWPIAPNRFFADREFTATDEKGEKVLRASSKWCLLDVATRGIVDPMFAERYFHGQYSEEVSGAGAPEKVTGEGFEKAYVRKVRRSDVDINMHVNNTNYVNYAVDAASEAFLSRIVRRLEITFSGECHFGEEIEIYKKERENVLSTVGKKEGKTCFSSQIFFF